MEDQCIKFLDCKTCMNVTNCYWNSYMAENTAVSICSPDKTDTLCESLDSGFSVLILAIIIVLLILLPSCYFYYIKIHKKNPYIPISQPNQSYENIL